MDILTQTAQTYIDSFSSFTPQFVSWGQEVFGSLLVINCIWMWIWYAFTKNDITQGMVSFLKEMFIVMFFFTVMVTSSWLISILKTSQFMGQHLTGIPVDPSSLISNGIMIGNKILITISKTSLLSDGGAGLIIGMVVYLLIIAIFIWIAVDLAVILITTSALISVAPFFLGFGALKVTSQIARNSIDVILANSVKLLGIYLVVAIGGKTILGIANNIPAHIDNFDDYWWLVASALIFFSLSKALPNQLARIVSNAVHEGHGGTEAAALAMTAVQGAKIAASVAVPVAGGTAALAKIAASTAYNAGAHFQGHMGQGNSVGGASAMAAGSVAKDAYSSAKSTVTDHFKNLSSKMTGGSGKEVKSYASRMHAAAQDAKGSYSSGDSTKNTGNMGSPQQNAQSTTQPALLNQSQDTQAPTSKPSSSSRGQENSKNSEKTKTKK